MDDSAGDGQTRTGCLGYPLLIVAGLWAGGITAVLQLSGWSASQLLLLQGDTAPASVWPGISWVNSAVVLLPVLLLVALTRNPRLRAVYKAWAWSALVMAILALVRYLPETQTQVAALAQIALTAISTAGLLALLRGRERAQGAPPTGMGTAVTLAGLAVLPWLAFGALGSPLDSVLQLLAGLTLGLFTGLFLDGLVFRPLERSTAGLHGSVAVGGFGASVAMALIGGGFGFAGSQLLLLASLPPLGFAMAAIRFRERQRTWRPGSDLGATRHRRRGRSCRSPRPVRP